MNRRTSSISLALIGSAMFLSGCFRQRKPRHLMTEEEKREEDARLRSSSTHRTGWHGGTGFWGGSRSSSSGVSSSSGSSSRSGGFGHSAHSSGG